ncbi:MAG: hypothetical protein K2P81_08190 [Bacteriovoracaceae bacterium]|nr:hypothetical protein [Bacteriovoracaceae bacterium]
MKLLILALCFFSSLALAQNEATVSVIAVGEAQDEKDQVYFAPAKVNGVLTATQQKTMDEVLSLVKNDFAFYKHRFDFATSKTATTVNVMFDVKGSDGGVSIQADVTKGEGKELGSVKIVAGGTSLRDEGHKLSDKIYRSITGKKSVFLEKIMFVSDRSTMGKDTRKELYTMDFDGRRVERLTFFNSTVISPSFSPDNNDIIFSLIQSHVQTDRKNKETKNIDLRMYDRKTKKFTTVSGHPGVNSGAVYSADGKSIYFTLTTSGNADIYEMNLASKDLRKITSHYADDVDPTVTADGSSMSFLSNRAGRAHIYIMDPRGTEKNVRRVSFVGQFNASPRYSPDGKDIVFTSWVDNGFDLYRIDSQGNNLVRLTKDFGSNEEPWWSPDGEFIIFTSQRVLSRTKAIQDIYIMNRDGEVLGQLTQDFGRCFTPRWTN